MRDTLYIGLMSGTSMDGVDGVLLKLGPSAMSVLAHAQAAFPDDLKQTFWTLNTSGPDEIHRAALAANALARLYAQVVKDLLAQSGTSAAEVLAVGAHGQTVRHQPQAFDGTGYTSQINHPALLAELTGIDVVADFRSRDVAAGGQGAPLVPAFHREVFGRPDEPVAVLNIGGIANITLIPPQNRHGPQAAGGIIGFDCGPGNALMDCWCHQHLGTAFDNAGQWAATGQVSQALLACLLDDPYFAKAPPKSTGRDLFNVPWLQGKLSAFAGLAAQDVQATLAELTAVACKQSVDSYFKNSILRPEKPSSPSPDEAPGTAQRLLVCGGGALNTHLMQRLQHHLPQLQVASTQTFGLPPLQVEAAAFAWLACKCMARETASLQNVTGAQGARILGAIYPA